MLVERHGIHVVPLYIVFGGDRTVPETDITDYNAFFEELRGAESLPTTSQPSVGDFTSVYEPLLADGGEVVSVHISGGLSGTPESARRAAETLEREGKGGERVHVFDSTTAAGGLGLLVLAAAHAAAAGVPGAEIVERLGPRRDELHLWFSIDTLEFLRRGGRIGAASAWIGSTLQVKPILTVQNEMTPGGARAHELARLRADGGLRAPVPRLGRRRLVRPAHQRAGHPRPPGGALPGDIRLRAHRRPARSAPCSPRTPARACWAWAACRSATSPSARPGSVRSR